MAKEIDADLLITIIEVRPVLWDKTSSVYKDRNETKQAWKEVYMELNSDFQDYNDEEKYKYGKEVVKRCVNIRDAYNKFLKKDKSLKKSGSGATILKKYVYAEQLKFLTKIFSHRPSEDSLSANPATEESEYAQGNNNDSQLKAPPRKHLGSRKRKIDDVEMRMVKALEQPEDRHISFFKGIVPTLHTFTEDGTLQFQMGVLQLVTKIKQSRFQSEQPFQNLNYPPLARTCTVYNPSTYPQNNAKPVFHRSKCPEPVTTVYSGTSSSHRNKPIYTADTANMPTYTASTGATSDFFHQFDPADDNAYNNPSSVESENSTQDSVYTDLDFT